MRSPVPSAVTSTGRPPGPPQDGIDLGPVRLHRVHHDAPAGYALTPTTDLVVLHVRAGHVQTTDAGVRRRLGPGDVALAARPDAELTVAVPAGTTVDVTTVHLPLLVDLDPQDGARRTARLRPHTLDHRSAAVWRHTTAYVRSTLDGGTGPDPGALLLHAHGRLVAATLLELFDPPPATRPDPQPASLRRAVAHIEAHPDVDLDDLARVAGVGVRALQLAFRKHLGTTPLAHLRRVRLEGVHADLLAADPERATIARIAGDWGFADPSRFTAQYKQAYGRLPSHTLHT
ncbi:helix-turn-helix transcriptional regulator [Klenkia sp. LSe6-5]|uniref:Helix-turn-helix transcriptional regulator n=1 Tax=Klenkia sesuvii TaxID=3103137 RepID=A0ABU8DWA5_9ACTN